MIAAITEAGVYDLPDPVYHADPVKGGSLSQSGAKLLLPPSVPARFDYERRHPPKPKKHYDLGNGAHYYVLGSGPGIVEVPYDNWRTKKAQEMQAEAHAAGLVPLLTKQVQQVKAMAAALVEHPTARALLDPDCGTPEQTIVWRDERHGIWRRCKVDWLPEPNGVKFRIPDYKTAESADPAAFARAALNYGYHLQATWYPDAARAVGLDDSPVLTFIVQEKKPPYLVSVVELDPPACALGRARNDQACAVYAECAASGIWPGYSDGIETVGLPAWAGDEGEGWAA